MDLSITLPAGYGLVLVDALLIFFLNFFLTFMVARARKRLGVGYPDMYAVKGVTEKSVPGDGEEGTDSSFLVSDADCKLFNCIQRAHQNTLETLQLFLAYLLLGGLVHPYWAFTGGIIWVASRVTYAVGYYTGDPDSRIWGAYGYVGVLIVFGCTVSLTIEVFKGQS